MESIPSLEQSQSEEPVQQPRPRTISVLGLITATALALSWLGSYALSNVLLSAGLMQPWAPEKDPRPLRLLIGFVCLMVVLIGMAGCFKFFSARQLKRIDRIAED
jgi:hypothetical protein